MAPGNLVVFAIIAYRPEVRALSRMLHALTGYAVIIVDNTPADGAWKLPAGNTGVRIVRPGVNLGFGGGANRGLQEASRRGAAWCVILNQDLRITRRGVAAFVAGLYRTPLAIAGPFPGAFDPKRFTAILPSPHGAPGPAYVSGSCMAIRLSAVASLGGFHEPYFMYYEDADYCMRANHAGLSVGAVTFPGIGHDDATSLGRGSFLHEYYLARNHLLFVEREAPFSVKAREVFRLGWTALQHGVAGNSGAMAGIRDYLRRTFGPYAGGMP